MSHLTIKNLKAKVADQEILKGINLAISPGEIHVLMGPNGSGKTTLAHLLAGKPDISVTSGTVEFNGDNLLHLKPEERFAKGLFLGFQYPKELPGVSLLTILRLALKAKGVDVSVSELSERAVSLLQELGLSKEMVSRALNEGFSGGEKKKMEIVQMTMLKPTVAVLDEPDTGVDIDGLKLIAEKIQELVEEAQASVLLITHYERILKYLKPDFVHVFVKGRIVKEGGSELAEEITKEGYKQYEV